MGDFTYFYQVTLECNVFQSNQQLWRNRVDILVDEFQEKVPPHPFNHKPISLKLESLSKEMAHPIHLILQKMNIQLID